MYTGWGRGSQRGPFVHVYPHCKYSYFFPLSCISDFLSGYPPPPPPRPKAGKKRWLWQHRGGFFLPAWKLLFPISVKQLSISRDLLQDGGGGGGAVLQIVMQQEPGGQTSTSSRTSLIQLKDFYGWYWPVEEAGTFSCATKLFFFFKIKIFVNDGCKAKPTFWHKQDVEVWEMNSR